MFKLATSAPVSKTPGNDIPANNDLSWFSSRVERARSGIFSEVATITPEVARRLLEANGENRNIRAARVAEIAADIRSKNFILNGEPILIAKDGSLNDGQHRLSAVLETGLPIESVMTFGVDRDSRYTVDMGAARTAGDFLGMEGAKYKTEAAAIARLHWSYRQGVYGASGGARTPITKQTVRGEYWRFEKQINSALELFGADKFARANGLAAFGAAYIILDGINKNGSALFFQRLIDGANLKKGDAILALRSRLMASRGERAHHRLETILRHWNAWRANRPVNRAIGNLGRYPRVEG